MTAFRCRLPSSTLVYLDNYLMMPCNVFVIDTDTKISGRCKGERNGYKIFRCCTRDDSDFRIAIAPDLGSDGRKCRHECQLYPQNTGTFIKSGACRRPQGDKWLSTDRGAGAAYFASDLSGCYGGDEDSSSGYPPKRQRSVPCRPVHSPGAGRSVLGPGAGFCPVPGR